MVANRHYTFDQTLRSSDMRRAKKTAAKLGFEDSFEQLQQQVNEAVIEMAPTTGALLKAAVQRVELAEAATTGA